MKAEGFEATLCNDNAKQAVDQNAVHQKAEKYEAKTYVSAPMPLSKIPELSATTLKMPIASV